MKIEDGVKLDFSDVLIKPKRSRLRSRNDVVLERTYKFVNSTNTWTGIPIMAANMDGVGTFQMARALIENKMPCCMRKHYTTKDWQTFLMNSDNEFVKESHGYEYYIPSIGANSDDLDHYYNLREFYPFRFLCVDVANGYGEYFPKLIEDIRGSSPTLTIIAGNVGTPEMTEQLILSGADIVKVGIGPGSVCTTRLQTGVGIPQLSAIAECADAAHGLSGHIIADGGCTCPGDVAKAFGAGADFVMLGGMLAGHREGQDEETLRIIDELSADSLPTVVSFHGMSSKIANETHNGGLKHYRSAEGKEVFISYKGPVADTIQNILGGLRSACTYVGAGTLKEMSKRTTFIRVNHQVNQVFSG